MTALLHLFPPHGCNLDLISDMKNMKVGVPTRLTHDKDKTANLWYNWAARYWRRSSSGHTDVVPIDGQEWTKTPFKMSESRGNFWTRHQI